MPVDIYYASSKDFKASEQQLNYVALNSINLLRNTAVSRQTELYNQDGVRSGVADFTSFYHYYNNLNTQFTRSGIITLTTSNGILNFNFAASTTDVYTSNSTIITNMISYKAGNYANYTNFNIKFESLNDIKDTGKWTIIYN